MSLKLNSEQTDVFLFKPHTLNKGLKQKSLQELKEQTKGISSVTYYSHYFPPLKLYIHFAKLIWTESESVQARLVCQNSDTLQSLLKLEAWLRWLPLALKTGQVTGIQAQTWMSTSKSLKLGKRS